MSVVRILILSDTHLQLGAGLPNAVCELAERADHILHAGDLITRDVLTTLEAIGSVTAVHGNVDGRDVVEQLPDRLEVELGGVRIGMTHNAGAREGRVERLRAAFAGCAMVVFGHSHDPELTWSDDEQFVAVNPGSPTQRRRAPSHTVAWLETREGRIEALELVHLDG